MKSGVSASLFPLRVVAIYPHIAALIPVSISLRKFGPLQAAASSGLFVIWASPGLTFHNHITKMSWFAGGS